MTIQATAATRAALTKVGLRSVRFRRAMESLIIRNERGQLVPMQFSESQEIIWNVIAPKLDAHEKIWLVCLKSRQAYISTLIQALTFIRTLEQAGTNSLVLAQDLHTSHKLFEMAKRFYDHLPLPKIKPPRVTELEFPFPGGVSLYHVVSAGTMAKGRGTTQSCVHASECAYWPHPEILDGLFQAMPDLPDTMWILESTANGMTGKGEMFFALWNAAVRGDSDLTPIFIPWFTMQKYRRTPGIPPDDWDKEERMLVEQFGVDGEQLAWRRRTIATKCRGSIDVFHAEYPSSPEEAFVASGQPAFDVMAILEQRVNIRPPLRRYTVFADGKMAESARGEIRVWHEPIAGHQYVVGADTAEGLEGGDYSCAQVIDMETLEQVAGAHGRIQYHEFAILLNALGRYYHGALMAIEVYPQGFSVQDKLIREHAYPRLHQWRGKPGQTHTRPTRHTFGWETNVWSRPLLIAAGQRAINHGLVTLHEDGLLNELMRFSKNDDGKYEASVGHDDRVLALLIALRSREENYYPARQHLDISDELPGGVRVVAHRDHTYDGQRRLSKLINRAREATRTWMTY